MTLIPRNAQVAGLLPVGLSDLFGGHFASLFSTVALAFIVAKHADNMSGKVFLDLSMTRNWLRDARVGVAIPIVFCSVSNQDTADSFFRSS